MIYDINIFIILVNIHSTDLWTSEAKMCHGTGVTAMLRPYMKQNDSPENHDATQSFT